MIRYLSDRIPRVRDDRGFALIFVLFVTTVVMIGTATTLTVVTGGVQSSRQNQDNAAALAAARAGVQRYLASLDASCPSASIANCGFVTATSATALNGTIGSEAYSVSAVNPGSGSSGAGYLSAVNKGTLIITSTGTSPVSAAGQPAQGAVSRTVTAAVSAAPNPLQLAYFSNYETVGSSFLNSYYGPRKITLSSPAVLKALGISALSASVSWNGDSLQSPTGYGDNVCDKLWYSDPSNVNDGDQTAAGRSTLLANRSNLPAGTDYEETGTLTPLGGTGTTVTRYAPCQTTFTTGENFNGPVYSRDAFYLSNSTTNGSGPSFKVAGNDPYPALWSGWTPSASPAAPNGAPYQSFPIIGGAPATGSGTVSSSPFAGLSIPTSPGINSGTCTFTGPTTITLSGNNAVVTSPLTSNAGSSCPGTFVGGVYTVPVTTTTIYVKNATGSSLGSTALTNLLGLLGPDITYYSPSAGDAYVSGTLNSGKLSIVTDDDIVVTGNILASHGINGTQPTSTSASGERSWATGSAAIDLVATNDVRVYHPVSCASGVATYGANGALNPSAASSNGWCPNDITGLYSTSNAGVVANSSGSLKATHPSLQYTNLAASSEPSEIDAAIFALNGSFYADNFDRGTGVGNLTVSGGVYENHHGLLGEEWETPSTAGSRSYSGFKLRINYLDYSNAGLGYVPTLSGGNALDPWQIVNITSGGTT